MTDLSRAVARLERAVQAAERGEALVFGQCLEDFPEPVQKRLTNDEEP
jgi:hypothetical protein